MKNLSIRVKMLILLSILTVVFLAGYALLLRNMRVALDYQAEEARKAIEAKGGAEAEKINSYLAVMQEKAADVASAGEAFYLVRQATGADMEPQIRDYLISLMSKYPNAVGTGLWYEPGVFFADKTYYGPYAYWDKDNVVFTMEFNTKEYDYHNQDWYTQAIPKGWDRSRKRDASVYWSAPYFDSAGTMALMVTVGGVMYDAGGKIIGMSTFDLSLEDLRKVVAGIHVTPSSLAFAVESRSGLVTAYPADDKMLLKPASELPFGRSLAPALRLGAGESTSFTADVGGVRHVVFYSVTPTGVGLGIAVPEPELNAGANALLRSNLITVGVGTVVLLLLLALIGRMIHAIVVRPIRSLADYSRDVAAGNLEAVIKGEYTGEFGVLRAAMDSMLGSLKDKMREAERQTMAARESAAAAEAARMEAEEATRRAVAARSEGMRHAALQLRDVVDIVASASEELSAQIEESHRGAGAQASLLTEAATSMEEMTSSVIEIARNAESAARLSENSSETASDGARQVGQVKRDVHSVTASFGQIYGEVDDLSRKADGIGSIAQTIEDIADQTNLLALNAAIEAARAGDAGRGFAVVADEVRKLAEKTMTATKEVGLSIAAIQQAVRKTLAGMDGAKDSIQTSQTGVDAAEGLLGDILGVARQASDQIRSIATAAEQQSSATEEINRSIAEVSRISGETDAAMQNAAQAVRQAAEQVTALRGLIAELERQ